DEALERLARKYFTSHGPATVHDFAWWSGLSLTECKQAIDAIKSDFICETVNGRAFRMKNDIQTPPANEPSALLLPSFDEFTVSYKDRSEIIRDTHYGKVITKNGLFSPIITLNGEIIGSWKKITAKKIALDFFEKTPKKTQELFSPEIKRLEKFYS
ncbi:MAG: winged helix DNA-binding domain-containing protein, partial [Tannerella sp.]|nr:winged helix DNA-binding domain-containing protein [Tannerella sp.]